MHTRIVRIAAGLSVIAIGQISAQQPQGGAPPAAPGAQTPTQGAGRGGPSRPRPYNQVVTDRAVSDGGAITVHKIDDRFLFEVPDTLIGRDFLLVSRIAGVDRKSTRLNSSHGYISCAVFCVKKKGT